MIRRQGLVLVALLVVAGAFLMGTSTGSPDTGRLVTSEPAAPPAGSGSLTLSPGPGTEPEPLRVLLIGDSIMENTGDHLLSELRRVLGDNVIVRVEGHPGSGLLTTEKFDWQRRFDEMLAEFDPDIVVALFVGNYPTEWPYVIGLDGQPILPDSPEFHEAWRNAAVQITDRAVTNGASMWWITPPPMRDPGTWGQRAVDLAELYRSLVTSIPDAEVIESASAVGGIDGGYVEELPDPETGVLRTVRSADGLHLTSFGGRLLAAAITYNLVHRL
ncbi:MAG: hypothetical protein M5U31_06055 [Acidimicrobiia bacterium]|nr:hypothetical protein [Acidimicrobiia bacterium]